MTPEILYNNGNYDYNDDDDDDLILNIVIVMDIEDPYYEQSVFFIVLTAERPINLLYSKVL